MDQAIHGKSRVAASAAAVLLGLFLTLSAGYAVEIITDADIVPTTGNEIGSGNGTLDYILFTESAGGAQNSAGPGGSLFDGDDANTDMPTGVNDATASESFVTSIGEIRDFYNLNFPFQVNEIVLFVDLNQVTGDDLTLNVLTIIIDYLDGSGSPYGDDRDDPASADVSSSLQNSTDNDFSAGTVLAMLDGPKTLALNEQGAGWADYSIHTGIDPFDGALSPDTRIMFHWESEGHSDGGDTVFMSGGYAEIPEPMTMTLVGLGAVVLLALRRKR